jgi:periplasmic protein TonB
MATTPLKVKPLLFQPAPRWHLWLALGGAVAIHLTAVALAQKREAPVVDLPPQPPQVVEATLAPPEATPPPEDIPLPEPPPPPEVQPEFHEERTPPPRPPPAAQQKFTPIKAQAMTMSRAKALAINSPRPQYPYEARSRHITGSGVCVVTVDPGSGNVTGASMTQSIGNPLLDSAALSAFRQWRFRPGTVSQVRIPITFTMTGASY